MLQLVSRSVFRQFEHGSSRPVGFASQDCNWCQGIREFADSSSILVRQRSPPNMAIEFNCPQCDSTIRVPDAASGKKGTCPACHSKLRVPVVEMPDSEPVAASSTTREKSSSSRSQKPTESRSSRSRSAEVESKSASKEKDRSSKRSSKRTDDAPFDPFLDALSNPIHGDGETNTALLDALEGPSRKSKSAKSSPKSAPEKTSSKDKSTSNPTPQWVDDPEVPTFETAEEDEPNLPTHFDAIEEEHTPPPPPATRTVAKKIQQQRSTGSWIGIAFFIVCGLGLVGGVAYFTFTNDTTYSGDRTAVLLERGTELSPKGIGASLIDVSEEAKNNVFKYLRKSPPRITTDLAVTEFGMTGDEFAVTIKEGSTCQLYRFPVDRHLQEFAKKNQKALEQRRLSKLKPALKKFFSQWDVGLRNGEHPKDFSFRDNVGFCSSVGGLGYAMAANVNGTIYPCVYEDDDHKNLYFLLPRRTKSFEVVGRYGLEDNIPSIFTGAYRVIVKAQSKDTTSPTKSDDADDKPTKNLKESMDAPSENSDEMPEKPSSGMSSK